MEVLLRPREAARLLNVSLSTLRNWDTNNKLKSIRTAGGHRRYKASELEVFQNRVVPPREPYVTNKQIAAKLDRIIELLERGVTNG